MKKTNKKPRFVLTVLTILLFSIGFFVYFNQVEIAEATWWNESWSYRKALTINSDQVTGDLTNFPVLVSLTDTNLSTHAQEDGDDFVFVDNTGKKLSHEIESYASSTGVLVAWVKLPSLSSTVDTDIYMYYGNQGVMSQEDAENVWDDNYSAVWHMNGSSGAGETDSTSNNNDLSVTGTVGATTTAKIGSSREIASNGNNYLYIDDNATLDGMAKLTVQAWVRDTEGDTAARGIVSKRGDFNENISFSTFISAASSRYFYFDNGNSDGTANDTRTSTDTESCTQNTWQMLHFVFDGTLASGERKKIFLDGQNAITATANLTTIHDATSTLTVGILNDAYATSWLGQFDEVRILRDALSAAWVETEYNNQNNPGAFFSASAEEIGPGPVGYWSFDEGYGTTAHDEGTNKYDGTIIGATWKGEEECVIGKCLYFDGSGDEVDLGSREIVGSDTSFTISAWVKGNSWTGDNQRPIYGEFIDGAGSQNYLSVGGDSITSPGEIFFDQWPNSGGHLVSDTSLSLNHWNYITYTQSGSDRSFYINGVLDKSDSSAETYTGTEPDQITIGSWPESTGSYDFHGYIDEVKIYPYARTADQVKQDYNAGLSGISSKSGSAVAFGGQSNKSLSDGLVGYWKFDESATTSGAIDSSGNGNDGAYVGTASTSAGKFGNAGILDGDDDYVNVGSPSVLDNMDQLSVSAWIKPDTIGQEYYEGRVVDKRGTDTGWTFMLSDTNTIGFYVNFTGNNLWKTATDNTISLGEWQHVLMTWDGSNSANGVAIYVNGEKVASTSSSEATGSRENDASNNLYIGERESMNGAFDGQIDEVRIYNRALSQSEVKKIYEWAPGPVAHWKFNEKNGSTAYDSIATSSTAGGNDGTISGATWTRGKYGSALNFDGTSRVNAGTTEKLDLHENDLTIMAWVNMNNHTQYGHIISKFGGADKDYRIQLGNTSSDDIEMNIANVAGSDMASCYVPALSENIWYHLTYSYDGTYGRCYLDGILNDTSSSYTGARGDASAVDFTIGSRGSGSYFEGLIDDVKVYNYARTQKQILEDMNGCVETLHCNVSTKSPVLHLSFDEGRGETVRDSSIYGNNGTAYVGTGGSQTATSSMWEKSGRVKGAMEFDGTDDLVTVTDSDSLDVEGVFTASAWIKNANSNNGWQRIFSKKNIWTDALGWEYGLAYPATVGFTGGISVIGAGGSISYLKCVDDWNTTNLNEWVHVLVVYNNTTVKAYCDGEYKDEGTITAVSANDVDLHIGQLPAELNNTFLGEIDEVKIWNFALSEDEIKEEYNNGASFVMGEAKTASDAGTTVTGDSTKYCIPGDTATCSPPVLELKMNEKTGGTVYDTSGNGNDGTITGATWARGKKGGALSFNESNDYIDVGQNNLSGATAVTVSFWANVDADDFDGSIVMALDDSTGDPALNSGLYIAFDDRGSANPTNGIKVDCASSGGVRGGRASNIFSSTSKWYYITVVYDSANVLIYVDGINISATQEGIAGNYVPSVGSDMYIGAANDVSYNFNGKIDDVKVYNYARTGAQIAWDHNKGKPIAHWEFDECYGGTIHDSSDHKNHGTLILGTTGTTATGTCASSSDSFWYNGRSGKKKGSGSFDGDDDKVLITENDNFDFTEAISIGAWVKTSFNTLGTSNAQVVILDKFAGATGDGFALRQIYTNGKNLGAFELGFDGDYATVQTDSEINDGAWHFLFATYDRNNMKIYLDGILEGITAQTQAIAANDLDVLIGDNNQGGDREFNGQIDEVRIYNYALTAEQVKNVYNDGAVSFK